MRYILAVTVLFGMVTSGTAMRPRTPQSHPSADLLSPDQAMRIVQVVARHDGIDLSDTHVEVNSLDLMSPFIPGYASFILIREATAPGPDETLHRYAVNRRTGDVWEMTQRMRYDFPALTRLQRALVGHGPTAAQVASEQQELGCSEPKSGNSPANPL